MAWCEANGIDFLFGLTGTCGSSPRSPVLSHFLRQHRRHRMSTTATTPSCQILIVAPIH